MKPAMSSSPSMSYKPCNSYTTLPRFVLSFVLLSLGFALGIFSSFTLNVVPSLVRTTQLFQPSRLNQLRSQVPPQPRPLRIVSSTAPPASPSPPPARRSPSKRRKQRAGIEEYVHPRSAMHEMSDDELLWRASMVPGVRRSPYDRVPKVAFLFLTRGPLPLAPLWEKFFKGHQGLYSIYVHSDPAFNESMPSDSVFHGRRVPSKAVEWGQVNMMEAERRLLANALLDFSNERFVLLSESCIPLFNFPTVYSYLVNSTQTHVSVYDEPGATGRGRYREKMLPQVSLEQWRKGSQWFEIDRALAVEIISDDVYFPVFQRHCKPPCYIDEHYLPTFINIRFSRTNANRSLTWVDWSKPGPHPGRFPRTIVTPELLQGMRNDSNCTRNNGEATGICFLFARKFLANSLNRLLLFAPKTLGYGGRR